jgi:hypothetical protein
MAHPNLSTLSPLPFSVLFFAFRCTLMECVTKVPCLCPQRVSDQWETPARHGGQSERGEVIFLSVLFLPPCVAPRPPSYLHLSLPLTLWERAHAHSSALTDPGSLSAH